MKKTVCLLAVATLLLTISCEKNVNIKIPEKDPSLVVNAVIGKGMDIVVTVGKSLYILKGSGNPLGNMGLYFVENAQVVVYENGVSIDTLQYKPGDLKYTSPRNRKIRDGFT